MKYHRVKNANGTFKTTAKSRFEALDADVLGEVSQPVSFLDVGCSSGQTTIDFLNLAQTRGVYIARADAVDLSLWGQVKPTGVLRPVSLDGRKIGVQLFGHVFWEHCGRLQKMMLYPVFYRCLSWMVGEVDPSNQTPFPLHINDDRISFQEANVMAPSPDLEPCFNFIRIANVLNLHMFSKEQIKVALKNIRSSLIEGGHLLIVRSLGPHHHGSLYVLEAGVLRNVRDFGDGSELKGLIEGE